MKPNLSKQLRKRILNKKRKLYKELEEFTNKRYYIRYSWKHGYPKGNPEDWRSWRSFAVVPILFHTKENAEEYLDKIAFKNMNHLHKCSASIEIKWLNR